MKVDLPELQPERLPLLKIAFRELHQVVQSGALVVAAYSLMQRPPHHLHRVALRRPRGQGIQTDATPGVLHVSPDPLACVTAVVVCGEVQLFVAAVSPPQMVEQLDEKLPVLAPEQRPRTAPSVVVEGGAALPEEA